MKIKLSFVELAFLITQQYTDPKMFMQYCRALKGQVIPIGFVKAKRYANL